MMVCVEIGQWRSVSGDRSVEIGLWRSVCGYRSVEIGLWKKNRSVEDRDRSVGDGSVCGRWIGLWKIEIGLWEIDRSVGCSKGKLEMGGRKWIRNGRGREKE